jgi:HlyD family secretion protein
LKIKKNLLEEEIGLVKELLSDRETLLEKKLVQNSQVVELKRNLNQLQSKAASLRAEIAKNESSKNEVLLEVVKLTAQTQQDALTELRDQQFREMELKERYSRLKTKIKEREIRSPVRGEVFGLTFFNPGTVVRPAEKIMGIVPFGSTYVIEAKISPIDIDEVYVGQIVRVNFSSIERSDQVDLYTKIDTVSADAFTDERNGQTYFKAILSLPREEINKLPIDFNVRPGMIAETYILKKDRNVITYLTDPLTGFFEKAFRE